MQAKCRANRRNLLILPIRSVYPADIYYANSDLSVGDKDVSEGPIHSGPGAFRTSILLREAMVRSWWNVPARCGDPCGRGSSR